nr:hypothetical protein CFP56_03279 [Quercus suber]
MAPLPYAVSITADGILVAYHLFKERVMLVAAAAAVGASSCICPGNQQPDVANPHSIVVKYLVRKPIRKHVYLCCPLEEEREKDESRSGAVVQAQVCTPTNLAELRRPTGGCTPHAQARYIFCAASLHRRNFLTAPSERIRGARRSSLLSSMRFVRDTDSDAASCYGTRSIINNDGRQRTRPMSSTSPNPRQRVKDSTVLTNRAVANCFATRGCLIEVPTDLLDEDCETPTGGQVITALDLHYMRARLQSRQQSSSFESYLSSLGTVCRSILYCTVRGYEATTNHYLGPSVTIMLQRSCWRE